MADNKKSKIEVGDLNIEQQKRINKLAEDHLGIVLDWNKAMKAYNEEAYEILDKIRTQRRIQKDIQKDAKAYIDYQKEIKENNIEIASIQKEIDKLIKKGVSLEDERIDRLTKEIDKLEKQNNVIKEQLKNTNKLKVAWAKVSNGFGKVNDGVKSIKTGINAIDSFLSGGILGDMFKMLRTLKTTGAEMGLVGTRSKLLQDNIRRASINTVKFGVALEDVAKIQATFSDELGTTQFVSQKALEDMSLMGKVTGLGSEAMAKMAGEMGGFGYNAERSAKFMGQVMNDTTAMGLNTSKVLKNIQANIKMLNKYNFKNGIKGLAKMAEKTTKMGVSLNFAANMADKLFDIEGAVEMSAQLQVMGGEWAKLGDPFKLMYMARNDMDALTTSIINATKGSATFNKKTGEFDISALKMHELRKVAEATGLNFEELAQSAKNAAKYANIDKQIKLKVDDSTREFIENTATIDENGRAKIMIGSEPKFLDQLTQAQLATVKAQAEEKKSLKDRAMEVRTFDEQFKALFEQLKIQLLPVLDKLNDVIAPMFKRLADYLSSPGIIKAIEDFASKIPDYVQKVKEIGKSVWEFIVGVKNFVAKFPKLSLLMGAGVLAAIKGIQWFMHGKLLGMGFNSVARVGGAGGMGGGMGGGKSQFAGGSLSAGRGLVGKGKFGRFMAMNGGRMIGGGLMGGATGIFDAMNAESTAEGVGNVAGGLIGGVLGNMLLPGLGGWLGGMLGSWLGGGIGDSLGGGAERRRSQFAANSKAQASIGDGIIKFDNNDKFMRVNDSTMIAGTRKGANDDLARAIMSSNVKSVPGAGGLMRGNASANKSSTLSVKHNDLKVDGVIRLEMDGVSRDNNASELLHNDMFVRDLNKRINQVQKEASGGGKL